MSSRILSRHAPQFQITLPSRTLQPVAVVSTQSPSDLSKTDWRHLRSYHDSKSRFDASEIFHNLFLGSWIDADSIEELRLHNVKRVLNVAEECPVSTSCEAASAIGSIQVKKLFLKDHSDENISLHLPEALAFVHEGILRNEGVLVHCRQGVSRSATIVLAYLMQYGVHDGACNRGQPMSYADAFDFVKQKRPLISPNLGFVLALHEVERAAAKESAADALPTTLSARA